MFVERRVAFTGDAEKTNLKDAVEAIGVADIKKCPRAFGNARGGTGKLL